MEQAIKVSLQYMSEREAFGRPINKFQVLRHRIAQMSAEIEALKAFSYTCCRMYADGIYDVKLCSMAKLLATELMEKVATQCLQFYGGYGFMEDYPMARMYRDVRVGTIGGGSSEIMREILAKIIIDDVSYQSASGSKKTGIVDRADGSEWETLISNISSKAGKSAALGSILKFDFGDKQIVIDGSSETNQVGTDDTNADCTVTLSLEDFNKLVSGNLNPMTAMMSGKMKIDGDMGIAMKLQSLLS